MHVCFLTFALKTGPFNTKLSVKTAKQRKKIKSTQSYVKITRNEYVDFIIGTLESKNIPVDETAHGAIVLAGMVLLGTRGGFTLR